MQSYPKMLNLFKFDPETKGRTTEFSCPEFQYLADCQWVLTEKIDGTNIRVIFDSNGEMEIRGRTDRAILAGDLVQSIYEMFDHVETSDLTFYGEGYGAGIQKGGCYRPDKSFILFDIYDNTHERFRSWDSLKSLADGLGIPYVPQIHIGSLRCGYSMVKEGLRSTFGSFMAEGLVGRPLVPLFGIHGQRIIVKIKHRDYYMKELVKPDDS